LDNRKSLGKRPRGDVAMFPRGAMNNPALFASACILFDSVTVPKLFDIEATEWMDELDGDHWDYKPLPNPGADAFWVSTALLQKEGVLKKFEVELPNGYLRRNTAPDEMLRNDFWGIPPLGSGPGWVSTWHAVGFTKFLEVLQESRTPTVLSVSELANDGLKGHLDTSHVSTPNLSTFASSVLSECIPEINIPDEEPFILADRICGIREATHSERVHFRTFVSLIAGSINVLVSEEERREHLEFVARDYKDAWDAYRSRLAEATRRYKTPLRFLSIVQSIVTLDFVKTAEKVLQTESKGVLDRQEKRSFGFLHRVQEVNDYWIPRKERPFHLGAKQRSRKF
jgi:hypothetical protein